MLIEALGKDADENHDGMISMSELTAYISNHLPGLTGDSSIPVSSSGFKANCLPRGCEVVTRVIRHSPICRPSAVG